jgi:hypothetical protein
MKTLFKLVIFDHLRCSKVNQQDIEKLNDITTQQFMRSTNGSHVDYLNQLIKKRNRIDHY